MHKLKTVLRSSHRKRDSTSSHSPRHSYESSEAASPRVGERASFDAHQAQSYQGRRSRPVSSTYDDHHASNASAPHYVPTGVPVGRTQTVPSDLVNGAIANDYKSYLPALSSVQDFGASSSVTPHGGRESTNGESNGPYEKDVADRNVDPYSSSLDASRHKPLPTPPNPISTTQQQPRNPSLQNQSNSSAIGSGPSVTSLEGQTVGQAISTNGLVDRIRPHQEVTEHTKNSWKQQGYPTYSARDESQLGWSRRRPQCSESDDDRPRPPPGDFAARRDMAVPAAHDTSDQVSNFDGQHDLGVLQDWKSQQKSLLNGVVDLSNTVDTDRDVKVAAPVVHEVLKPHEHEVIQKKIYREIHNYSYFHRLQPVMHTEVLPPRHFIPNPNGEGLIEVSADELPMRTGKNRWWEIVQKETPQTYEIQSRWRTEPEVIEGEPYITEQGVERRETTIIYPPKLEDMSDYTGEVQPVHFDHKTGERWMGEVTTMAKLREQYDQDMVTMKELTENLPQASPSPVVKRRPVGV